MKLNLGLIVYSLQTAPAFICGEIDHPLTLTDVRELTADTETCLGNVLYHVTWDILTGIKTIPAYLICIDGGKDAAMFIEANCSCGLVFAGGTDRLSVICQIQNIFLTYMQTEHDMLEAIISGASTQTILNCCAELFKNHVVLFDNELNLLDYSSAYQSSEDNKVWKETLATRRCPRSLVEAVNSKYLLLSPEYKPQAKFIELKDCFLNYFVTFFYDDNKRVATINIFEGATPLSTHLLRLLDYVAEIIQPFIIARYNFLVGLRNFIRSTITAMLQHKNVDSHNMRMSLESFGWSLDDDYLLLLVRMPEEEREITHLMYIYESIFVNKATSCIATKHENNIVMLLHNNTAENFWKNLPGLNKQLLSNNAECGVSLPFCDFLQLTAQYSLAQTALKLGAQSLRIRQYRDVMREHLIHEVNAIYPLRYICHHAAVRIHEFDKKNNMDLLLTLETYLRHNKSLKAAAEELYVHRSTVTYRLNSIDKIAAMSLDNPDEMLHLLLSCMILRSLGD